MALAAMDNQVIAAKAGHQAGVTTWSIRRSAGACLEQAL